MPKKLYALLVGVNDYPQILPLKGCVPDVERLALLLQEKYKHLEPEILCLKNEEATREQIIHFFRAHLGQAQNGDTVFFHFSGHGSREHSPSEFWAVFPDKKNETLVCYDSRYPKGSDLADVELAVLLWEISLNKPNLHLVVSLDCCHSGSGTRDADDFRFARPRQAEKEGNLRTLKDYLSLEGDSESFFEKNIRENQGKLIIPSCRHLLLAACDKRQKAWESLDNKGIYTTALIETLEQNNNLSYAELFQQIRILVHRKADFQDPQLENYLGFDAFCTFLEGKTLKNTPEQSIYFKNGSWQIDLGAVHGLKPFSKPDEEILLNVFAKDADTEDLVQCLGTAKILKIKAQNSLLELHLEQVDAKQIYRGIFRHLPLEPLEVFLSGEENGKAALKNLFENPLFGFLNAVPEPEDALYEIKAEGNMYKIFRPSDGKFLQGIPNREAGDINYPASMGMPLLEVLEHLGRWHNFDRLQNPRPRLNPKDIEFNFYEIDPEGKEYLHPQEDITLDSFLENEKWQPIRYRVEVKNNSPQSLFFQMFFVNNRYGIYWANSKEIPSGQSFPLMYKDNPTDIIGFHPKYDQEPEIDLKIKLLVSTEALEPHLMELKSLEIGKILGDRFMEAEGVTEEDFVKIQEDWFSKELRIKIVKNLEQISNKNCTLAGGKIIVEGHDSLKAKLAVKSLNPQSRSAGEMLVLEEIPGEEISRLNFAPNSRSASPENILELSEIEGEISIENPLYLQLDAQLAEDEGILPLTYSDGIILPVGWAERMEEGKIRVCIQQLPAQADERRRGLGKALQLLFLKVIYGRQGKDNAQLSSLRRDEKGKIIQESKKLKESIQKLFAEKPKPRILLLIHGIIGNNRNNFKPLSRIQEELGYDLILAFDYESLNTSIEDTAANLKTHLREVGLDQFKDKSRFELDILAHSMGGLIARKFIEESGGDALVNRLVMLGTPNGGSVFGSVPAYLDFATKILVLGLNYLNPYIGSAVGLIWILEKNKDLALTDTLFRTLRQMEVRSSIIEGLQNNKDPQIPYFLIAGDASLGDPKSVLRKIKQRLSSVVLEEPNDGVVSHQSMKSIGSKADTKPLVVAGHHLNYFSGETSLEQLKALLGGE